MHIYTCINLTFLFQTFSFNFTIKFSFFALQMNDRGEISVWRRLDYEQEQKFLLRIVATDGLHTDYANVTITVMDVNGKFS